MNDFHFIRPLCLILLLPFSILLFMIWRKKLNGGAWVQNCAKHLLPYILNTKHHQSNLSFILFAIMGIISIAALAGPSWEKVTLPLIEKKSGLVIAINLSSTLHAQDLKPSRLQRALYKVNDILNMRHEGLTALIVYSDEAFIVTPLTDDTKTITALLPSLDPSIMPTQGNRPDRAIEKSKDLLTQANITDGKILLIAAEAGSHGVASDIPVSVLGVGTEQGAPIPKAEGGFVLDSKGGMIFSKVNKTELADIAHKTGGRFTMISTDDTDINYLLSGINQSSDFESKDSLTMSKSLDGGYWLVLIVLPLAAILLRRGGFLAIPLILCSINVHAITWNGFWQTPDQQGHEAFTQEQYQEAASLFDDNDWQAAAHFKSGNYEEAATLYQNINTPDGCYNHGNALAKQGKFDDAIAAYSKALDMDPNHEDAAYNKQLLEEMKEQQEQQNQQSQDKDENQDQEDKSGDSDKQDSQDQDDKSNESNKQDSQDQQQEQDNRQTQQPEQNEDLTEEEQKDFSKEIDEQTQDEDSAAKEQQNSEESECDPQTQLDNRLLERIPDDPGALLRRKFLYQYRNQKGRP